MTKKQEEKIKTLLTKYNDILLVSMRLAVAEDFTNLIILNKDDTDFELRELLQNKDDFTNHVMKEFLKQNSSSVVNELSSMQEQKLRIIKQTKLKFQ
jgi:hypothetical protein